MSNRVKGPTVGDVTAMLAEQANAPTLPCDPMPVVDGLKMRRALGRKRWGIPVEHGCCGWQVDHAFGPEFARILVTADHQSDRVNWIHASISHRDRMPDYDDLALLHRAVFGPDRWAYQVFAPESDHISIHAYVLHLWGRVDGAPQLPDFGRFGTI